MVDPLEAASGPSARTRVRRLPEKARTDRSTLHAVLDAGVVAHVGFVDEGQPFVVPVGYARDGDEVLVHGSTASRLFRRLAEGADACLTVTLLDGIVVARSAFESSMHYRSAMVLGSFRPLHGDEQIRGLRLLTEHFIPHRWDEVRPPLAKELKATMVLALSLTEASVKVSDSPPEDPPEDVAGTAWAGVVPMAATYSAPEPAPDLSPGIPIPRSVWDLTAQHRGLSL